MSTKTPKTEAGAGVCIQTRLYELTRAARATPTTSDGSKGK